MTESKSFIVPFL